MRGLLQGENCLDMSFGIPTLVIIRARIKSDTKARLARLSFSITVSGEMLEFKQTLK